MNIFSYEYLENLRTKVTDEIQNFEKVTNETQQEVERANRTFFFPIPSLKDPQTLLNRKRRQVYANFEAWREEKKRREEVLSRNQAEEEEEEDRKAEERRQAEESEKREKEAERRAKQAEQNYHRKQHKKQQFRNDRKRREGS